MNTRLFVSALATGLICLAGTSNVQAAGLLNFGGHGCGCEVSCCDPCGPKLGHRLKHLFSHKHNCCEEVVSCGCEPSCGHDMACGCEPTPCCDRPVFGYRIRRAFQKCLRGNRCGCEPSCGVKMGCNHTQEHVQMGCGVDHVQMGCGCDACAPACRPGLGHHLRKLFTSHRHCGGCDTCGEPVDMGCGCH